MHHDTLAVGEKPADAAATEPSSIGPIEYFWVMHILGWAVHIALLLQTIKNTLISGETLRAALNNEGIPVWIPFIDEAGVSPAWFAALAAAPLPCIWLFAYLALREARILSATKPEQFSALSATFGSSLPLTDIPVLGTYTFLIKPTFVQLIHKRVAGTQARTSGLFPVQLLLWNAVPSLLCMYVIGLPLLSPGLGYRAAIALASGLFIAACYTLMEIEARRTVPGAKKGSRKRKLKVLAAKLAFIVPFLALWAWSGMAPRTAPLEIDSDDFASDGDSLNGEKLGDGLKAMLERGIRFGKIDLSSIKGPLYLVKIDSTIPHLEIMKNLPEGSQIINTNIRSFLLGHPQRKETTGNLRIEIATLGDSVGHVEIPDDPSLPGKFFGHWKDVNFERCEISNTTFYGYDFDNVDFDSCTFNRVSFVRCRFQGVSFATTSFQPIIFSKSQIVNSTGFPKRGPGCILTRDSSLLMEDGIETVENYRSSNNEFIESIIEGCEHGRP